MDNPNEYNDDAFTTASLALHDAVSQLWDAGASENDIEGEFANAIENAKGG